MNLSSLEEQKVDPGASLMNDLGFGFFLLLQVLNQSDFSLSHPGIGQLKNIFAYYYSPFNLRNSGSKSSTQLLQMEFLLALKSQLEDKLDKWQEGKNFILSVILEPFFFPCSVQNMKYRTAKFLLMVIYLLQG